MTKANARALKRILESKDVRASLQSFLARHTKRSLKKPIQREREAAEKKEWLSKKEETAAIREAVFARAKGRCERRSCLFGADEMDHWLGGNGRRRQRQSIETCWMLCKTHHYLKTINSPSAAYWNGLFAEHCDRYGYPFVPHITHAEVSRG